MSARLHTRYTAVAIFLHWIMAAGVLAMAVIGLAMTHVKLDPMRLFQLYQLHKSIGITILLAAVLRLVWRLGHRPPELPNTMLAREKLAAAAGHVLLYAFLFALPLTGWALVSSSPFNIPTLLYGMVPGPDLLVFSTLSNKAAVEGVLKLIHAYGAYALIALVTLHAAAALRHHFVLKDNVLKRMLPWAGRRSSAAGPPSTTEGSRS